MFFGLELEGLQIYWWVILSLLGGLLVFMFFVQGGQTLIDELSSDELEKTMLVNSLGRKWELGFTTLVLFGGAAFAAFPLFYSTSFGGAYWAWLCILFCFILQAVAYEYRKKENNVYGSKTYEVFLKINGYLGVFLIGVAISSFFSGSHFVLNEHNFVSWQNSLRGLELLFNPFNYLLGIALVFLSRILGAAYFMNNIKDENIKAKAVRKLSINSILFLPFFLGFLAWIFIKEGFGVDEKGIVSMTENVYLYNFLDNILFAILFIVGVVFVLLGMVQGSKGCSKTIFTLGFGSVLAVFALFLSIGLGSSAFYPSLSDLQSSLTIRNASSSYYTLSVMAYVSLLVPFVLAYIIYVWNAMDRVKITREEMKDSEHLY
ncbi:cytochrome d ubiquinol oxidase subunit II [Campylobacter coli]|uniref:Cytochrome d ubiquinol oxidase subunit II n=3 Tax=Campylobacter coli TaxID=195 RepID=B1PW01_CAMCO|nr:MULTISPECIES: cytochrome d ubiquinol oxidase subunit II [Campylobacter]EAK3886787.1 cytochrome d ubiquinol oxidase subunit II [Campylobacter hyointestinalis]EAL3816617.1 cytochrome d ubiquinol oxidase subunit II [Campylobacter fetus]EIA56880.1 cytochrome d ubiquinol oxidase, subunit II [Campylobacter coli 2698]EIB05808.1 cytochrome d ubiquinol oxidase, subunit II [Campylobacter coli H6]KDA37521.1 cytochrome C oxidase assembly protein [Campylobacter jejuni K5]